MDLNINDNQLMQLTIVVTGLVFGFLILTIHLLIKKLVNKRNEIHDKTNLMVITDELTQLYNKEQFDSLFESELARAMRNESNISCALIEIDNYKELKDKYGHQLGDDILQDTAEVLKDDLRLYDVIARVDDRFICFFPETEIESALIVTKRLHSLVENEKFEFGENNEIIRISVSIGLTSFKPILVKEIDIYQIILNADNVLDIAKEKGGNRVEYI
jgi:diguanylate cyclase (GGDEF)-like protein